MEERRRVPSPPSLPRLVGSRARRECRAISSRIAREFIEGGREGDLEGEILPRAGDVGGGEIERASMP